MGKSSPLVCILMFLPYILLAQVGTPTIYKQIDTVALQLDVCYPLNLDASQKYPAIVFFHAGGWIDGDRNQFTTEANYFAERGFVSFLVEYRVQSIHETSPMDALSDAKSAIRHIRQQAETYQIDPDKIIAIGSSAGSQLALGTAFSTSYDDPNDPLDISSTPDALVLYNPILDTGPGSFGYNRLKEEYMYFSPLHTIRPIGSPVLLLLGDRDRYASKTTIQLFMQRMKAVNNDCELILFPNVTHALFSPKFNLKEVILEKTYAFVKKFK